MDIIYTETTKKRLDAFLHERFPERSRTQLQKSIRAGQITVNAKSVQPHHWLKYNDRILMNEVAEKPRIEHTEGVPVPIIIYNDDEYAVILKPAGLLMHPTEHKEKETFAAWLIKTFPAIQQVGDDPTRPGIVHRLDKDVGGLVLITLTQSSFEYFKQQFKRHVITKKYQALVHGIMDHDEGQIDVPIERNKKRGRMVAQSGSESGKEAVTLYSVLKHYSHHTLLDVQIITGRTHQIRTHLFSIGHSIVGDPLYQTRDLKRKKNHMLMLERPFLYAYELSFIDPQGRAQQFTQELPVELKTILAQLH